LAEEVTITSAKDSNNKKKTPITTESDTLAEEVTVTSPKDKNKQDENPHHYQKGYFG
jgi:hypothetical protein